MTRTTPKVVAMAAIAAALAFGPPPAQAHEDPDGFHYESGGRYAGTPFHWDMISGVTRYAGVRQGTNNMFSGNWCGRLRVNGTIFNASGYVQRGDRRGFRTNEWALGNLRVTREFYVPEDGLDFGRWVDTIRNTGAGPANVPIEYYCYYGSCPAGTDCTEESSDGDDRAERNDTWFAFETAAMPAAGILSWADGADRTPTTTSFANRVATVQFSLDIPAGATQRLLVFVGQGRDAAEVAETLDHLSLLPPEATVDWEDGLPDFVNFATDGRPAVSAGGPYTVSEGGDVVLEPRIFDRDGDPLRWSWDLDGDGAFDDSVELNPTLSANHWAGLLDGDSEFTVSLYVVEDVDGGREVIQDALIEVVNVAPVVLDDPPTEARRGGEYRYSPEVVDPAGALDPWTIELVEDEVPVGMSVVPGDGASPPAISWTPSEADLDESPHHVHIVVEDDDGGTFEMEWDVHVRDNTVPFDPGLLYPTGGDCILVDQPTLKVSNASDLDDDPLTYYFEVDAVPNFQSSGLLDSGPLPEGIGGFTEWKVPRRLLDGELYYWRAWVSDGVEESQRITEVFEVCIDRPDAGPEADADTDTDTDTDTDVDTDIDPPACACRTTRTPGATAFGLVAVLAAVAFLVRRRT